MASPADIDKDFLSKCLGERYEILDFDVTMGSKPGDNFLSVIYSASVTLKDVVTQKTTLRHFVIKCYPSHPGRQDYNNQTNVFYRELKTYKSWLPELLNYQTAVVGLKEEDIVKPPYPPFITGKATNYSELLKSGDKTVIVSHPLENFLMMEDLRKTWGFKMTDRRSSFDLDHIKLVIAALARLHALSWGYKHHVTSNIQERFSYLQNPFKAEDMDTWIQVLDGSFDQMIATLEEDNPQYVHLIEAIRQYQPKVKTMFDAYLDTSRHGEIMDATLRVKQDEKVLETIKDNWEVILHGDCWSNNMLFRYDEATGRPQEVILVDLQIVFEGCPTFDLSYVLYASCRSNLRKAHLPNLLQLYVDTFNDTCAKLQCPTLPNFNLETLSARFHRTLPQAFMTATMLIPIMLKEEGKAINLDEMDHSKEITELFGTAMKHDGQTGAYKERIVELLQELYDLGVI